MSILAFSLIAGATIFVFMNNEAHCADHNSCLQTSFAQTGMILPYSEEALHNALDRGDKLGFYFEASRCANCKLLKEDLMKRGIPANSTILTIDFDTAKDLRAQYGVDNLHTIVVVDQDLNLISKDETWNYEQLITLLQ